tara:strand:+ start:1829 stop:2959 length:1131 start_codon:yes stop_codon:yes gene_type:complete
MAKKKNKSKIETGVKNTPNIESTKTVETVKNIVTPTYTEQAIKEVTMIEKYQEGKNQSIAIRTFFDSDIENMGLENYSMSLFEGVVHEEELTCLEVNGIKRYVTGLNEFAPEIRKLPPVKREAKIKEIRKAVSQLERDLAANIINPEDPEFWNKVKLLRHDNHDFWSKISIRIGNDPVYLDPSTDPYDLIKIYAIEAGGFSIVAKNLATAKGKPDCKFYLDKLEDTVGTRTEVSKLRNRALAALTTMYDSENTKLFYVAKIVDVNNTQYNKSTANDVIYENMDAFIHGDGHDRNQRRSAQLFLDTSRLSMEDLKLKAIIKDASAYSLILNKADGWIYFGSVKMGKTSAACLEWLKNPLNEEHLMSLISQVEYYWNM